ncbi:MAG: class I SAM-dependent methyltransferase [Bacteroidetes bacterium]|nr:class I SAM-dependent methyltransferase [Bacteroidota bacterium]
MRVLPSSMAFKLRFYHYLMSYLKVLALYLEIKNPNKNQNQTTELFNEFKAAFGVRKLANEINPNLAQAVINLVENNQVDVNTLSTDNRLIAKHFILVRELVSLYRNAQFKPNKLKQVARWKSMIARDQLDYEIRLAETLFELRHWRAGHKIKSPFSESYYSESGRNAFKNFTKPKFMQILSETFAQQPIHVLDVGCGYGNYIDAVTKWNPNAKMMGLEIQSDLAETAQARFASSENVDLQNTSIFDFETDEKFDLVLFNYVLFYFSNEQKQALLEKIKTLLAPNGKLLICQYYAGIEPLKVELAKAQNDYSLTRQIEMFYGNKVLYANAFWNQTADTFSEAENWERFETMLNSNGFQISNITNADRFYYSLFVEAIRINV